MNKNVNITNDYKINDHNKIHTPLSVHVHYVHKIAYKTIGIYKKKIAYK